MIYIGTTCTHEGTWHCDKVGKLYVAPGPRGMGGNYFLSESLADEIVLLVFGLF